MLEISDIQPGVSQFYRRITLSNEAQIRIFTHNYMEYREYEVREYKTYSSMRNPIDKEYKWIRHIVFHLENEDFLSDEEYLQIVQDKLDQDPQSGLL